MSFNFSLKDSLSQLTTAIEVFAFEMTLKIQNALPFIDFFFPQT